MAARRAGKLPEVLARVAERCGETAALRLACQHGGRNLYVPNPRRLHPSHPLVRTVGVEIAVALHAIFGNGHLLIPIGPAMRRRGRTTMPAELRGASTTAVARALGCHIRTAARLRKRPINAS